MWQSILPCIAAHRAESGKLTCSVAFRAADFSASFSFRQPANLVLTDGGRVLVSLSQLPIATRMLLLTSSLASSLSHSQHTHSGNITFPIPVTFTAHSEWKYNTSPSSLSHSQHTHGENTASQSAWLPGVMTRQQRVGIDGDQSASRCPVKLMNTSR